MCLAVTYYVRTKAIYQLPRTIAYYIICQVMILDVLRLYNVPGLTYLMILGA